MAEGVIVDASVALAWLFGENDPSEHHGELLTKSKLLAPTLWKVEVVNAILVKERRKQITEAQGLRFLHLLESLGIETVVLPLNLSLDQLALLARPHQLTAYDAVYLHLAVTTGLPLYSYDHNLQRAAKKIGVELIVS